MPPINNKWLNNCFAMCQDVWQRAQNVLRWSRIPAVCTAIDYVRLSFQNDTCSVSMFSFLKWSQIQKGERIKKKLRTSKEAETRAKRNDGVRVFVSFPNEALCVHSAVFNVPTTWILCTAAPSSNATLNFNLSLSFHDAVCTEFKSLPPPPLITVPAASGTMTNHLFSGHRDYQCNQPLFQFSKKYIPLHLGNR